MSYGSIDGSGFGSRNPFGGPSRQGYQPLGEVLIPLAVIYSTWFPEGWSLTCSGSLWLLCKCHTLTRGHSWHWFSKVKPKLLQFDLCDWGLTMLRIWGCGMGEQHVWGFGGILGNQKEKCRIFPKVACVFCHVPITFTRSLSQWLFLGWQMEGADERMYKNAVGCAFPEDNFDVEAAWIWETCLDVANRIKNSLRKCWNLKQGLESGPGFSLFVIFLSRGQTSSRADVGLSSLALSKSFYLEHILHFVPGSGLLW